jgi:hypothetical protein
MATRCQVSSCDGERGERVWELNLMQVIMQSNEK